MKQLIGEYRASLKAIEVEEPIDLAVHRPLAFLIAKLANRTPVTPNQLTGFSVSLGVTAGLVLFVRAPWAPWAGAGLLFWSQVVDCSDGMLARMRKSSSDLGRMLDGTADLFTLVVACAGSIAIMTRRYSSPAYLPYVVTGLSLLTMQTSSFHTTAYDHYKNLYVRLTVPGTREEEDLEAALARYERARAAPMSLVHRVVFFIYLGYLKSQRRFMGWFDPHTVTRSSMLPPYADEHAAIYRRRALPLMKVWRSFFGVGTMVFGLALFNAFGRPELYLALRLVVLNAIFFFYLWPAQKRASRLAFEEMGITTHGSELPRAA